MAEGPRSVEPGADGVGGYRVFAAVAPLQRVSRAHSLHGVSARLCSSASCTPPQGYTSARYGRLRRRSKSRQIPPSSASCTRSFGWIMGVSRWPGPGKRNVGRSRGKGVLREVRNSRCRRRKTGCRTARVLTLSGYAACLYLPTCLRETV